LDFQDKYASEAACIQALAQRHWPQGYICGGCGGRQSYQLKSRPRVFECAGRGHSNPHKSLLVMALEKCPVEAGKGIKQSGFVAGRARLAVLASASGKDLQPFVRATVKPGSQLLTDSFAAYRGLDDGYHHQPVIQGKGKNAEQLSLIVHVLFSNLKTWLNSTHHGVSAKHLPRYVQEWNYRFNRRKRISELADFVLNRAVTHKTITYRELVMGIQPKDVLPALTG
jgi:transposase-like protein